MDDCLKLLVEIVKATAWPIAAVAIAFGLRNILRELFDRAEKLTAKGYGIEITMTAREAQDILQQLLNETLSTVRSLEPEDRKLFRAIRDARGSATVEQINRSVFEKEFTRDGQSGGHKEFRRVRDFRLIRPEEGGSWRAQKHPVMTRFAELILRIKPDAFDEPTTTTAPTPTKS